MFEESACFWGLDLKLFDVQYFCYNGLEVSLLVTTEAGLRGEAYVGTKNEMLIYG